MLFLHVFYVDLSLAAAVTAPTDVFSGVAYDSFVHQRQLLCCYQSVSYHFVSQFFNMFLENTNVVAFFSLVAAVDRFYSVCHVTDVQPNPSASDYQCEYICIFLLSSYVDLSNGIVD